MPALHGPIDYERLGVEVREELRARLEVTLLPLRNVGAMDADPELGLLYAVQQDFRGPTGKDVLYYLPEPESKDFVKLYEVEGVRVNRVFRDVVNDCVFLLLSDGSVLRGEGVKPTRFSKVLQFPSGQAANIDVSKDGKVYVINSGEPRLVYRSTDGGMTWSKVLEVTGTQGYGYSALFAGKGDYDADLVVVMVDARIGKHSTDAGETWTDFEAPYHMNRLIVGGRTEAVRYVYGCGENTLMRFRNIHDPAKMTQEILWQALDPLESKPYGDFTVSEATGNIYMRGWASLLVFWDAGEVWVRLLRTRWRNVSSPVTVQGYLFVGQMAQKGVANPGEAYLIRMLEPTPRDLEPVVQENTSVAFWLEAIRDTADHYSFTSAGGRVISMRHFSRATIVVQNTLDQDVTIQVQGSHYPYFDVAWDIGPSFTVAAGSTAYETLTDFFPYIRVKATCSVAPTTGVLNVWVYKRR